MENLEDATLAFETWVAYAVACAVLSLIPGPSVLLVTGQALARGLRAALICIAGELTGGTCLILFSLLGVGAVLAASATLFLFVKWLGVAYLAYLGVQQILDARRRRSQAKPQGPDQATTPESALANGSFGAGFLTALLNPKSIVFYMAFLSQFLDPTAAQWPQFVILIATSALVAGLVLAGYALAASQARRALKSERAQRGIKYASGGFYVGGSALMAATR